MRSSQSEGLIIGVKFAFENHFGIIIGGKFVSTIFHVQMIILRRLIEISDKVIPVNMLTSKTKAVNFIENVTPYIPVYTLKYGTI